MKDRKKKIIIGLVGLFVLAAVVFGVTHFRSKVSADKSAAAAEALADRDPYMENAAFYPCGTPSDTKMRNPRK